MRETLAVAIFSDHDSDRFGDASALCDAILRFAPIEIRPRLYTVGALPTDSPQRFTAASWNFRQLVRQVRLQQAEVVHIATTGVMGLAGRWVARYLGLPLLASWRPETTPVAHRRLRAVAEAYKRWLHEPCGARNLWVRGVDTELFHPSRVSPVLRTRWHVDHRRPAVLCLGVRAARDRIDTVLAVERLLHRHCVAHQFVVADCRRPAAELTDRWPSAVFVTARTPQDVAAAMASAHIALLLDEADPIGAGVLEAQACGLPVIAATTKGDGHRAMLGVGHGIVRVPKQPATISNALLSLLTQPTTRRDMGSAARTCAVNRSWPVALQPLVSAWQEVRRPAAHNRRIA